MSKIINVAGVEVELRKHHFSKQLKLSIRDGKALVTLPKWAPYRRAEQFAQAKSTWILQQSKHSQPATKPTNAQREQARERLQQKLQQWAPLMDITWQKLRIGNQTSRWGSCSSSGTLSFNWRALHLSDALLDYLVIHELAHVSHPNHSPQFWQCVARYDEGYKRSRQRLRQIDFAQAEG